MTENEDLRFTSLEDLGVSQFKRDNLQRLLDGTERFVRTPGGHFSMGAFTSRPSQLPARVTLHDVYGGCGTSACLAGHGPLVGIPALEWENWYDYAYRVFAQDSAPEVWVWLFDGAWTTYDDTLDGARRRLWVALNTGVPNMYLTSGNIIPKGDVVPFDEDLYARIIAEAQV